MTRIIVQVTHQRTGETREVAVPDEAWPFHIGRDPACHVVLDDPAIEGKHVRVERAGWHTVLHALARPEPLVFDERKLEIGASERIDQWPFRLGPYSVRVAEEREEDDFDDQP